MADNTKGARSGVLSLYEYFEHLFQNISPSPERREAAKTIPAEVRAYLEQHRGFATIDPHTRLVGSYSRGTAIHGIKDVDFVVFVGGDKDVDTPGDVLKSLRSALNDLPGALGLGEADVSLRNQRRSVHVEFVSKDFFLDIVPALRTADNSDVLHIPDKEWARWIETDPLGYGDALSELNGEVEGKAVRLAKLLKHWRSIQMQRRRPKNYWLEVIVYRHLKDGSLPTSGKGYSELFRDLLDCVWEEWAGLLDDEDTVPVIADPMLDNNVAFNWERDAFVSFMKRIDESRGWATRAVAMPRDRLYEAVALWQKVFGADFFEDTLAIRTKQIARWVNAGTAYVGSSGSVSDRKPSTEVSVVSPPHRFYGDAE